MTTKITVDSIVAEFDGRKGGSLQIIEHLECRCGYGEPRGIQCNCPWTRTLTPKESQQYIATQVSALLTSLVSDAAGLDTYLNVEGHDLISRQDMLALIKARLPVEEKDI